MERGSGASVSSNRCPTCHAPLEPPGLGHRAAWCYACEERQAIIEADAPRKETT